MSLFAFERVSEPDPTLPALSVAEVKRDLREFSGVSTRDADIAELIQGAREWVEDFTGRTLIDTTWRLSIGSHLDLGPSQTRWPGSHGYWWGQYPQCSYGLLLRRSPVLALVSVVTVDSNGDETVVDAADYALQDADSKWPRVTGLGWPSGITRIVFRAGFVERTGSPQQDASVIPVSLKRAMKLWIKAHYDRDERMEEYLRVAELAAKPEQTNLQLA